jgi:non-specific serine/threonine protein kinase/protein-serine/threonine kinase
LVPDTPPWLQEAILRCLEVDPANRYDTAAQLAFDLSHPEQIKLTARAQKTKRDSLPVSFKRWLGSKGEAIGPVQPARQTNLAPIIMAAVDFSDGQEALSEEVLVNVKRLLATMPGVRIACVNVLKLNRLTITTTIDEDGRSIHVQRLVELKEWARPLDLDQAHVTFHVLEHMDPAEALIEFAGANNVDQVLIGAGATSAFRRYLGSVASQVVARAGCTVTVVREPRGAQEAAEAGDRLADAG